jgi:transcriptional regulator with XRE-family HTH domain
MLVTVSVGENVKRLRKLAGLATQSALAEKMGVPQPRASDLENDRYEWPDIQTLLSAAKAIGCSLDDLLAGVDAGYDQLRTTGRIAPPPPATSPAPRPAGRAQELFERLSAHGQALATEYLEFLGQKFPRRQQRESVARTPRTKSVTARKVHGTR